MFSKKVEPPANAWADKPVELMSYDELLAVKMRVDQEINNRGPGEIAALKEKLTLAANAQGIPLADLFSVKPKTEKKKGKSAR